MPSLTIQLPGHPPVEHVLREEIISLGRSLTNRIGLDHSSVSQQHATITRIGSGYFLQDLRSTNGTLLNGQSVREAQLHDGDILKFGEVTAIFETRAAAAPVGTLAVLAASSSGDSPAKAAKSDTAVLSSKAKTSRLTPLPPATSVPPAANGRSRVALPASLLAGVLLAGIAGGLAWLLGSGITSKPMAVKLPPAPAPNVGPANYPAAENQPSPAPPPSTSTQPTTADAETNVPISADLLPELTTNNLPELLIALKATDVNVRRQAAEAIAAQGAGATNALLNLRLALLQDADPEVRMWLAFALVQNHTFDAAAVPELVHALQHAEVDLRQRACAALALIPYDDATRTIVVPALKTASTDEHESVRRAAQAALKIIAPDKAVGP